MENSDETKMSEEILALVDEFQQAWPLEGFGGALEMKGRRLDLQGIRVLKKGPQDGVAKSSCYGDCRSEDDEATEWVRVANSILNQIVAKVLRGRGGLFTMFTCFYWICDTTVLHTLVAFMLELSCRKHFL